MANGNYELYINGFTCHSETWDDSLNRDGWHDEVFFLVNTRYVNGRDGIPTEAGFDVQSATAGDDNGFTNRIKAGSGRDLFGNLKGGFVSTDSYPTNTPWLQTMDPTNRNFPPFRIWSGTLEEGDPKVTFITPTIWEWDPGADALQGWAQWQVNTDTKFGARAKDIFSKIWPVTAPIFDAVSLEIQTFGTLIGLWSPLGNSGSRPIGLQRDPNNPDGSVFNPPIITLTYEMAEFLVNADPNGKGKGIFGFKFVDDSTLRGDYQVWLQIKKVGGDSGQDDNFDTHCTTVRIEAGGDFLSDGGAAVSGFLPSDSDDENIIASISGWQPGGGSHPTGLLVKRSTEGGKNGIWFRVNFVNDQPNGAVWISFYQNGQPNWSAQAFPTQVRFDTRPWH